MGCGNTKTDKNSKKYHLKIFNSNQIISKKNKRENTNFHKQTSLEINKAQEEGLRKLNDVGQVYFKLAEEAKVAKSINWKNLIVDNRTYFDLLNALEKNENLEHFSMEGVEIVEALDTFINWQKY